MLVTQALLYNTIFFPYGLVLAPITSLPGPLKRFGCGRGSSAELLVAGAPHAIPVIVIIRDRSRDL